MIYFVIGIVVLLLLMGLFIFICFLKMKEYDENMNICEKNVLEILSKKKEILDKFVKLLDNEKVTKLYESYNDELNMFEKEELLFNINWEANKYMTNKIDNEKIDEHLNDDNIKVLVKDLNLLEENLQGLREYYNANAINYNEKYYKKPFNYIYSLFKLKAKRSFKLRKLEEYEILKN